jgi:hypothetical protein
LWGGSGYDFFPILNQERIFAIRLAIARVYAVPAAVDTRRVQINRRLIRTGAAFSGEASIAPRPP